MYKYFVSYVSEDGFGNTILYHDKLIDSYEVLLEIEREIKTAIKCETLPVIINYRRVYEQ